MTYHWTEHDIIAGRWVYVPREGERSGYGPHAFPHAFRAEEVANHVHRIGFDHWHPPGDEAKDMRLVAASDGMIGPRLTKAEMAARLNHERFAPLPHKHLIAVLDHLRDANLPT